MFSRMKRFSHLSWTFCIFTFFFLFLYSAVAYGEAVLSAPKPQGAIELQKAEMPSENIFWAKNIKVLASVGQKWDSYFTEEGSFYTKALARQLLRPEITGFEDAQAVLEKNGYWSRYVKMDKEQIQFPISTPRRLQNAWLKNDRNVERYVLLLGQQVDVEDTIDERFNKAVLNDIERMKRLVQNPQLFNVSSTHIQSYPSATMVDVKHGVDWLQRAKQEHIGKKVDILIYYTGHGTWNVPRMVTNARLTEGSVKGKVEGPDMPKIMFQALVNQELGMQKQSKTIVNVLIIYDMCHSGFMIAKNTS